MGWRVLGSRARLLGWLYGSRRVGEGKVAGGLAHNGSKTAFKGEVRNSKVSWKDFMNIIRGDEYPGTKRAEGEVSPQVKSFKTPHLINASHTAGSHGFLVLQMRGQGSKEANSLAQGHTALGGWIQSLTQVSVTPKPVVLRGTL